MRERFFADEVQNPGGTLHCKLLPWHAPQYSTPNMGFVLPTTLQEKVRCVSIEKHRSTAEGMKLVKQGPHL